MYAHEVWILIQKLAPSGSQTWKAAFEYDPYGSVQIEGAVLGIPKGVF